MLNARYKYDKLSILPLNSIQIKAKEEVEQKVINETYVFESIICPICQNMANEILAKKDRYGLQCTTMACDKCGMLSTNPRMNQASYNQFYMKEYRRLYTSSEVSTDAFFDEQLNHGNRIADYITTNSPLKDFNDKFVIEIGCGAGGILKAFKDKGAEVTGLDLGDEYIMYGKNNHQLHLVHGSIHEHTFDRAPDVIIYSHVLEHILDLDKELQKLKEISHPETIIYIEVPGVFNVHNAYGGNFLLYLQNAHTYHFCLDSLLNLFSKFNFKLLSGDEYVKALFIGDQTNENSNNTYNCYPKTIQYLKKIERRYNHPTFYKTKDKVNHLSTRIYNRVKRIFQ